MPRYLLIDPSEHVVYDTNDIDEAKAEAARTISGNKWLQIAQVLEETNVNYNHRWKKVK